VTEKRGQAPFNNSNALIPLLSKREDSFVSVETGFAISSISNCHCEEQSDVAISFILERWPRSIQSLAMTK